MAHLRVSGRFVYEYLRLIAKERCLPDNDVFLQASYRAILQRPPDEEGWNYYRQALRQRRISKRQVVSALMASDDFKNLQRSTIDPIARAQLFRQLRAEYRWLQQRHPDLSNNKVFLRAAYRVMLKREPDPDGEEYFLQNLEQGHLTQDEVLRILMGSDEFRQVQGLVLHSDLRLRIYARVTYEYARLLLENRRLSDDGLFLRAVYRAVLRREIDEEGMASHRRSRQHSKLSRRNVINSLTQSSEFKRLYGLPIRPLDAIHQSRMMLFQEHLPPAEVIVDLGGAAHNDPKGALLAMGYPHHPREIIIVDLPPADRIGGQEAAESSQAVVTGDGIRIRYLYRSMADLAPIPDASTDMVVSGESIEHISEADADIVCQQVYRILKPGGVFCLDTPNALLTRLQLPDKMIHPEHQKEYYVHEIRDKLEHYGFEIAEAKAICPMPGCIERGVFDFQEMVDNIGLSDNPEEGYMFYFKAIKPPTISNGSSGHAG